MSESTVTSICMIAQTVIFGITLLIAFRKNSQKRDVTIDPGLVNRKEYDEAKTARDKQLHEIVTEMKENREKSEQQQSIQRAGIYRKIDEVRVELKGDIDGMRKDVNHQVNELLSAVGRMEGKVEQL